jgi:hypothetical protein
MEARKILFLASSPKGMHKLSHETEYETIAKVFSRDNIQFGLETARFNVNSENLFGIGQDPHVLHLSAHGRAGKVFIADKGRKKIAISISDFMLWLGKFPNVSLIFLSICDSVPLARRIIFRARYVISFNGTVLVKDAIKFSEIFYKQLSECNTVPFAFINTVREIKVSKPFAGDFEPFFHIKHKEIMEKILENKPYELRELVQQSIDLQEQISAFEIRVVNVQKDFINIYSEYERELMFEMKKNEFHDELMEFFEVLPYYSSETAKGSFGGIKDGIAEELYKTALHGIFRQLLTNLVLVADNYTSEEIFEAIKDKSHIPYFREALIMLKAMISKKWNNEATGYFIDGINTFNSLLKEAK